MAAKDVLVALKADIQERLGKQAEVVAKLQGFDADIDAAIAEIDANAPVLPPDAEALKLELEGVKAQLSSVQTELETTKATLVEAQADDIADDEKIAKLEASLASIDLIIEALKPAPEVQG